MDAQGITDVHAALGTLQTYTSQMHAALQDSNARQALAAESQQVKLQADGNRTEALETEIEQLSVRLRELATAKENLQRDRNEMQEAFVKLYAAQQEARRSKQIITQLNLVLATATHSNCDPPAISAEESELPSHSEPPRNLQSIAAAAARLATSPTICADSSDRVGHHSLLERFDLASHDTRRVRFQSPLEGKPSDEDVESSDEIMYEHDKSSQNSTTTDKARDHAPLGETAHETHKRSRKSAAPAGVDHTHSGEAAASHKRAKRSTSAGAPVALQGASEPVDGEGASSELGRGKRGRVAKQFENVSIHGKPKGPNW